MALGAPPFKTYTEPRCRNWGFISFQIREVPSVTSITVSLAGDLDRPPWKLLDVAYILRTSCLTLLRNNGLRSIPIWVERFPSSQLCSSHSKYYWLFLSRRIPPETTEEYDRPTTPYLHRATSNLSVLKYGKQEQAFTQISNLCLLLCLFDLAAQRLPIILVYSQI